MERPHVHQQHPYVWGFCSSLEIGIKAAPVVEKVVNRSRLCLKAKSRPRPYSRDGRKDGWNVLRWIRTLLRNGLTPRRLCMSFPQAPTLSVAPELPQLTVSHNELTLQTITGHQAP